MENLLYDVFVLVLGMLIIGSLVLVLKFSKRLFWLVRSDRRRSMENMVKYEVHEVLGEFLRENNLSYSTRRKRK